MLNYKKVVYKKKMHDKGGWHVQTRYTICNIFTPLRIAKKRQTIGKPEGPLRSCLHKKGQSIPISCIYGARIVGIYVLSHPHPNSIQYIGSWRGGRMPLGEIEHSSRSMSQPFRANRRMWMLLYSISTLCYPSLVYDNIWGKNSNHIGIIGAKRRCSGAKRSR
jgi:hypothetical protein